MLCISPNNSNQKVIPFCSLDKWMNAGGASPKSNMKVLCDMLTRSGAILNFVGLLVCSKHNKCV